MNKKRILAFTTVVVFIVVCTIIYLNKYQIENSTKSIQSNIKDNINRNKDDGITVLHDPEILEVINLPNTTTFIILFRLDNNYYGYAQLVKGINNKFKLATMGYGTKLINFSDIDTNKNNYIILYGENSDKKINHILLELRKGDYSFTADISDEEIFFNYYEIPIDIEKPISVDLTYYDKGNKIIETTKTLY